MPRISLVGVVVASVCSLLACRPTDPRGELTRETPDEADAPADAGCGASCSQPAPDASTTCTPKTCAELGPVCGRVSDGCDDMLWCVCAFGSACSPEWTCVPSPPAELTMNVSSTSSECEGLLKPAAGEPVSFSFQIQRGESCGNPVADANGTVALTAEFTSRDKPALAGGLAQIFYVSRTGVLLQSDDHRTNGIALLEPIGSGFHKLERRPDGASLHVVRSDGVDVRAIELGHVIGPRLAAHSDGGTLVTFAADVAGMRQFRASRFDAEGRLLWESDLFEARLDDTYIRQGPDPAGGVGRDSLVIRVQGEGAWPIWVDEEGRVTSSNDSFVYRPRAPGTPLYEGGMALLVPTRPGYLWTVVRPPELGTGTAGVPGWLSSAPPGSLRQLPSGAGYALILAESGFGSCADEVQVRTRSGELCGTYTAGRGDQCQVRGVGLGLDGTLIRLDSGSREECADDACTCTYSWWPELLKP